MVFPNFIAFLKGTQKGTPSFWKPSQMDYGFTCPFLTHNSLHVVCAVGDQIVALIKRVKCPNIKGEWGGGGWISTPLFDFLSQSLDATPEIPARLRAVSAEMGTFHPYIGSS